MNTEETAEKMKRDKDAGEGILAGVGMFVMFLILAGMSGCVYRIWTG